MPPFLESWQNSDWPKAAGIIIPAVLFSQRNAGARGRTVCEKQGLPSHRGESRQALHLPTDLSLAQLQGCLAPQILSVQTLELLWVCNEADVRSKDIRETYLWERWNKKTACPFGFCWRYQGSQPPFDTWKYCPPYLPEGVSINVGKNSTRSREPKLFTIPFGQQPSTYPDNKREPLQHGCEFKKLTRATLVLPEGELPTPKERQYVQPIESDRLGVECGKFPKGFDRNKPCSNG